MSTPAIRRGPGTRIGTLRLRPGYAIATALLLLIEIIIALFIRDGFVRPYLGDVLAVALVYCALRAAFDLRPPVAAATAFLIAVVIEFGQLFQILRMVGLQDNIIARTVLGSGFDPADFLAYAAGALGMLAIEHWRRSRPIDAVGQRAESRLNQRP